MGNFWSFGAGWRISEEAFMKDVKWVNNLKLRASYGETGNDNILIVMVILIIILIRPYMVWDIRMAQKLEPTSR